VAEGKTQASGVGRGETSLGQFLAEARKSGGYTPEQVAAEAHIPSHYIRAIETDDYGLISDQLYLLPFVRRYAAFIGLDPEDVASRFVHDVQKAETTATKTSEPIPMITRESKSGGGRYLVMVILLIVAGLTVLLLVRRPALLQGVLHLSRRASAKIQSAAAQPPAGPQAAAPGSVQALPFESSITPAPAAGDSSAHSSAARPPSGAGAAN